jgi:hypothetical protein
MSQEDEEEWGGFDDNVDDELDDFSQLSSVSGIPIHPEGPPRNADGVLLRAERVDDLQDAINQHGKDHGYAVTRSNGYKKKKTDQYISYWIKCDKYGAPRVRADTAGLRKTSTTKDGCEFKGWAKLTSEGWVFKHHEDPRHHVHNHPPSLDPAAHPQHRKINSPVKNLVGKLSAYTSIRAREITAMIREDYPDSHYTTKDINNQRQRLRLKERDGCTASGALIKAFDEEGVTYVTKWDPQDPDRLAGIVFTFPDCVEMWKRFPDCLSLDNTHCTNGLGFPLFVVTAQTNINSTANIAFGLIDNERRAGFDFLIQGIEDLRIKVEARSPAVAITDKDDQMRDAIRAVWPDTQQQLCRFHINKNVHLNAKTKGKWPPPPPRNSLAEADLRHV